MKLLTAFFLLFSFQYTFSGIVGDTKITGRVLKYNTQTVTLLLYRNKKITVPRSSIKRDFKKLKTGLLVTAVFSSEEVMDAVKMKVEEQKENQSKR